MTPGDADGAGRAATGVRARIIITGDELLRGFIRDANGGYLAERLRELGVEVDAMRIVGDDYATIEAELRAAHEAVELVIITGGLGPTHDDRTSEAVASALGTSLALDPGALAVVESRVRAYGRMRTPEEVATFTPGNHKQATFPAGARWVDPLGTAPGFIVADGRGHVTCVLPGPPSELRHAWRELEASAELQAILARVGVRRERLLRVWGVPESRASQLLASTGHVDEPACRVTICARDGELELAVRGSSGDAVDALAGTLATELGAAVFALDDDRPVVTMVADALADLRWRAATAESCTGGMLGSILTAVPGSSAWYVGGIVAYANELKVDVVGVDAAIIEEHGAVSEPVARALATGARSVSGAEVGIGITGVAGPGGGTEAKPVGTVHVAISTPAGDVHRGLRMPGDRDAIRQRTCAIALHELRIALMSAP